MKKTIIILLIIIGIEVIAILTINPTIFGSGISKLDLLYLDGTTMKPRGTWDLNIGTKKYYGDGSSLSGITGGTESDPIVKALTGIITSNGSVISAITTSAGLAGIISDESGSDKIAFTTSPVFTTPNIGSATGSISGNAGTATALAGDPADCAANNYAYTINASGTLTCSTIDISNSTNLAAGRSLTLSGDSIEADTELYTDFKGTTIETPTDADNFFVFESPVALTITRVTGIVESATSAVLTWQECDSAGNNCSTIESVTADVDGTISTSIDNASIDAGDIIRLDVGTVTGTVGQAHSTITFTIDD